MLVIIGSVIVLVSVLGGFMIAGGHPAVLLQWSEFIIILGSAFGAMVTMAPMKVHKDMIAQIIGCLKGSPYNKTAYEDMFKALYEMFMLGRRNGMVALEPHLGEPSTSSIFTKYEAFSKDHHAIELLTGALRPLIDGKVKPDQVGLLMETEITSPSMSFPRLQTPCPDSGSWRRCWVFASPWNRSVDRWRKSVTTWPQHWSEPSWAFWSPMGFLDRWLPP
jgi:chemotaxis protein MotA